MPILGVSQLMKEYFDPDTKIESRSMLSEQMQPTLPISAKKSNWNMTQDRKNLIRSFSFKSSHALRYFVNDLLQMQSEIGHWGQVLVIEKEVKVKVGTQALERITELDIEYASQLDKIYDDYKDLPKELGENE